ncbi:MAG TPA: LysR family transcriptional regulator [Pseudomonadales bacterium]|nr:LysR family transcriptional regulator [Pseudomonadales bacterium]
MATTDLEDSHTLDQWRMLAAVVDRGGFAAGAEALGKSQSAVSYGVQRLQAAIGTPLLAVQGRKAVLTPEGEILLRRARHLLEESASLQRLACNLARGHEPLIRLAVDTIFPVDNLFCALAQFSATYPDTRIELFETVLSGGSEALLQRTADLVLTARVPPGFFGEPLTRLEFVTVAHPDHPLHKLGRPLSERDLAAHRQIVIRDSGLRQKVDAGWLGAEQRWTVSHISTSIAALVSGLGFASLPRERIERELAAGLLTVLPLEMQGSEKKSQHTRDVMLYLVFTDRDESGPAVKALAQSLRDAVKNKKL